MSKRIIYIIYENVIIKPQSCITNVFLLGTQRGTNKRNMRNKQKMRLKRGVSVLIT